jgi:hypothetical protein
LEDAKEATEIMLTNKPFDTLTSCDFKSNDEKMVEAMASKYYKGGRYQDAIRKDEQTRLFLSILARSVIKINI